MILRLLVCSYGVFKLGGLNCKNLEKGVLKLPHDVSRPFNRKEGWR
jgi:hypothetical protein